MLHARRANLGTRVQAFRALKPARPSPPLQAARSPPTLPREPHRGRRPWPDAKRRAPRRSRCRRPAVRGAHRRRRALVARSRPRGGRGRDGSGRSTGSSERALDTSNVSNATLANFFTPAPAAGCAFAGCGARAGCQDEPGEALRRRGRRPRVRPGAWSRSDRGLETKKFSPHLGPVAAAPRRVAGRHGALGSAAAPRTPNIARARSRCFVLHGSPGSRGRRLDDLRPTPM